MPHVRSERPKAAEARQDPASRAAPQASSARSRRADRHGTLLGAAPGLAPGRPLDQVIRKEMERSFGRDFGGIRIHDDASAHRSARSLGALAYSAGDDLVFAQGNFAPQTAAGRALLAHELAHSVQQAGVAMKADGPLPVGVSPGLEAEADRAALAVSSGRRVPALSRGTTPAILRSNGSGAAIGAGISRQAEKAPDKPPLIGPPTFSTDAVAVAAMTNERLNSEALRVDGWLRAHSTGNDPDLGEYWKLARKLRNERHLRVAAGHVWMAKVGVETPTRLIGLLDQGGFHTIVDIDLKKAFGAPASPGMLIMTEAQFRTLLVSQGLSMAPPESNKAAPGTNLTVPTYATATLVQSAAPTRTVSGSPFGPGQQTFQGAPSFGTAPGLQPGGQPFSMLQDSSQTGPGQGNKVAVATMALGGAVNPKNIGLANSFAGEYQPQNWAGKMGETSFQGKASSGYGSFMDPTNQRGWIDYAKTGADGKPVVHSASEQNYPIHDFEVVKDRLVPKLIGIKRVSVKASQGTPGQRMSYYRQGLAKMMDAGSGNTAFEKYVTNQPGQSGTPRLLNGVPNPAFEAQKRQILSESFLAVNADDVAPLQKQLKNSAANWKYALYRRIYEAELAQNPILLETPQGTVSVSHPDHINKNSFGLTPAQLDQVKLKTGENAARRIVSSGITTGEMGNLSTARKSITLSPSDIELKATPQYFAQTKAGGGFKGSAIAAGRSGLQGGGGASLIVLLTSVGEMVFDEADHPDWEAELAEAGIKAFGPGMLAGGTEQVVVGQASAYTLSGGAKWLSPKGVRFAGGGAAAGVVELLSMLVFEERPHTSTEIGARTARTVFIGGTSSIAGTAAAGGFIATVWGSAAGGTAAGTAVPGWGNVVGFVIGLLVGVGSYFLLDTALPGRKEDWDKDYAFDPTSIRPNYLPSTTLIDKTAVGSRVLPNKELIEAHLRLQRQRDLEEGLMKGSPFAAGVDDEAIPAGYGLRDTERSNRLGR